MGRVELVVSHFPNFLILDMISCADCAVVVVVFTHAHIQKTNYQTNGTHTHTTHATEDHLRTRLPEVENSLRLVRSLLEKKQKGITNGVVRYSLSNQIFAKAEADYTVGTVNLWLGANVMLEYTYEEAIEFLQANYERTVNELELVTQDLAFVRDQIVTSEVNVSRIYNWDVRRKRSGGAGDEASPK